MPNPRIRLIRRVTVTTIDGEAQPLPDRVLSTIPPGADVRVVIRGRISTDPSDVASAIGRFCSDARCVQVEGHGPWLVGFTSQLERAVRLLARADSTP